MKERFKLKYGKGHLYILYFCWSTTWRWMNQPTTLTCPKNRECGSNMLCSPWYRCKQMHTDAYTHTRICKYAHAFALTCSCRTAKHADEGGNHSSTGNKLQRSIQVGCCSKHGTCPSKQAHTVRKTSIIIIIIKGGGGQEKYKVLDYMCTKS